MKKRNLRSVQRAIRQSVWSMRTKRDESQKEVVSTVRPSFVRG
ncbi:hypothetical protein NVP1084O_238 [Vibrio phage 1.084.O._10N.261.49.F5]|nr:hypothetical protein NVP1084O_238 [Vibrio phage 1.084.O._10N.261.49.F5]